MAYAANVAAQIGANGPGGFRQTDTGFEIHDPTGFVRVKVEKIG